MAELHHLRVARRARDTDVAFGTVDLPKQTVAVPRSVCLSPVKWRYRKCGFGGFHFRR